MSNTTATEEHLKQMRLREMIKAAMRNSVFYGYVNPHSQFSSIAREAYSGKVIEHNADERK